MPGGDIIYYDYVLSGYLNLFNDSTNISLPVGNGSLVIVYNITGASPWFYIKTNLTGPVTYSIVDTYSPQKIIYGIAPGTYTVSISQYNPSTINYVFNLSNITITPNSTSTGGTITVNAQASGTVTLNVTISAYSNYAGIVFTVTISYGYSFLDIFGNVVYNSGTSVAVITTGESANINIVAPPGIGAISFNGQVTGTNPAGYPANPSSFSTIVYSTSTYISVYFETRIG